MENIDEDKLCDILAILLSENRPDLVEYIKKIISECECYIESSDSEGEYEEISVKIDENGFHSLN